MKAIDVPAYTLRTFRAPATWGAIAVYGLAWTGARLLFGGPHLFSPTVEFLIPFLIVTGHIALGPLPWLWTGDGRPTATPLRGLLQAVPWNLLWLFALASMLISMGLAQTWNESHQMAQVQPSRFRIHPLWGLIILNLPLALILGWFLADKERAEASERELRILADQARAQALQAQLNPHVLFNVLSGLTELVHEDADAAEEALVGLTELYRQLTQHGSALVVPLAAERQLVERYLEIEEIRLGDRLDIEWQWPPWADALVLPPLLMQPLVENAIKHGISPHPEGGRLCLSASREPERLILSVANTGMPLSADHQDGTGLGNLRKRLALMARDQPELELIQDGPWTVVRLTFRWRWNP